MIAAETRFRRFCWGLQGRRLIRRLRRGDSNNQSTSAGWHTVAYAEYACQIWNQCIGRIGSVCI